MKAGPGSLDADAIPGILSNADPARHVADFSAGFDYLQGLDFVPDARIGMNGYCFGGGITWRCATAISGLKAAVPFYGPAPDLAQVPKIKAAVFGVYAEQDTRITGSSQALAEALKQAGVTYQMKVYPGVNHAFNNDTGTRYNQEQALQAWRDMLAWFAKYL